LSGGAVATTSFFTNNFPQGSISKNDFDGMIGECHQGECAVPHTSACNHFNAQPCIIPGYECVHSCLLFGECVQIGAFDPDPETGQAVSVDPDLKLCFEVAAKAAKDRKANGGDPAITSFSSPAPLAGCPRYAAGSVCEKHGIPGKCNAQGGCAWNDVCAGVGLKVDEGVWIPLGNTANVVMTSWNGGTCCNPTTKQPYPAGHKWAPCNENLECDGVLADGGMIKDDVVKSSGGSTGCVGDMHCNLYGCCDSCADEIADNFVNACTGLLGFCDNGDEQAALVAAQCPLTCGICNTAPITECAFTTITTTSITTTTTTITTTTTTTGTTTTTTTLVCTNQWTGVACDQCESKFLEEADCGACAADLFGYPDCLGCAVTSAGPSEGEGVVTVVTNGETIESDAPPPGYCGLHATSAAKVAVVEDNGKYLCCTVEREGEGGVRLSGTKQQSCEKARPVPTPSSAAG
jgi:hypothetical protein